MFIESIEKQKLLKPLQVVIGIVERKQTLPILSNVLIENIEGKIKFTATDLEIQISTEAESAVSESIGQAITVGGKKFQEILRVLPDQSQVSVEIKDNKALLKTNKSRFTLQTLPSIDFPKLKSTLDNTQKIVFSQKEFKELLGSVLYAMAQQDVRYYLNGVLLVIGDNQIKAVATDGHRLAFNAISANANFERREIIIPRKAIIELSKLLSDSTDEVSLEFSNQYIKISFSGISLISKLIDGKFPDYERVIPSYTNSLNLQRNTVQQALLRAAILSNEKFRGVRFVLTEKNLSIISSNSEQEEAHEDLETDYIGNALDIGFNVNYLLDGLNNIASEEVIFSFGDSNSSILMTTVENPLFKYVVMPMRI